MKKYIYLFLLIALMACKPSKDDAIAFNDKVVDKVDECTQAEKIFLDKCDTYDKVIIDNAYKTFKTSVEATHSDLEKMEAAKEFEAFKTAALEVTGEYKDVIEAEYKDYAYYYSLSDDEYGESEEEESGKVAKVINQKLEKVLMHFDVVQEEFAKDFDFTIAKKK